MEVVRKRCEQEMTDHLNNIDITIHIKLTYEEESDSSLPFLGTRMVPKRDGTMEMVMYQKKTHTDQYLNVTSHHPLRCNSIVS